MSPHFALLLTVCFALWFLARDMRARPQLSYALWIPWLWLLTLGSRPVCTWFGVQTASANAQLEGNPVDRLVDLLLIIAGVLVVVRRRISWSTLVAHNKWLFVFFLYLGISVFWSEYPLVAFKRWSKDVGMIIMVLVILSESDPVEAVKAVFLRCAYLLVPMSILFIKYFPDLGRSYDPFTGAAAYSGVSDNKNMLGGTLIVYGVVLFWEMLDWHDARTRPGRKFGILSCLLFLAMVGWLFRTSNCQTGMVCTLLGTAILVAVRYPWAKSRLNRVEIYVSGFALLFLTLNSVFNLSDVFIHTLGRQTTLSGRTGIWERALSVPIDPLIGTGFYSFWLDPKRVDIVSADYYFKLNEAHDGYLETYLNEGLIGVFLLAAVLIFGLQKIKRDLINEESGFNAIRLAFLAIALVYNFTEAAFDRLDFVWFALLLVVVGEVRRAPIAQEDSRVQPLESNDAQGFDASVRV